MVGTIGGKPGGEGDVVITKGSEWRRWEPHVHAPGTVLNNQFGSVDPWESYINALEEASPVIEAIAVTDYYVPDAYVQVVNHKALGRLQAAKLIFPNIEVRLDVATAKGGFVNLHLLVSPEDADHLEQLLRLLARLQFSAFSDRFDCTRAELIRLGRRADPTIIDTGKALSHGASQFKVNFTQLRDVYSESDWAKRNILIAVAGNAHDGTSGVRDAADRTIRQEIEKFAHIVFASSPAQREFWLGQRDMDETQLRERFNGLKPCLHGSDAHTTAAVGAPVGDRYSWIKGSLEFDTLRQACIDPVGRAHVGSEPPRTAIPSQVISHVSITNAPWAKTHEIPLNPGLVAIIGARGSGKTALADMIAAGSDSITAEAWKADENDSPSFLARARPLIGKAQVTLTWGNGNIQTRFLDGSDFDELFSLSKVRYLSQQFVEELCSSGGASDGLLREIERVIFDSHPRGERDGAIDFAELLEQRAARFRQARDREADAVAQISERISLEVEKHQSIEWLKSQIAQKKLLIDAYTNDRSKLVIKGSEAQVLRHSEIGAAAENVGVRIRQFSNQRRTFIAMQDEVKGTRTSTAPEMLRQARVRHAASGMSDQQWAAFLLDYSGDVDLALSGYISWSDSEIRKLNGVPPPPGDPNTSFVASNADLNLLSLAVLQSEMSRLEKLVSADKEVQRQYALLSAKLSAETAAQQTFQEKLTDAEGALGRVQALQIEREKAYGRTFDAIIAEQEILERLYQPLLARLAFSSGSLNKLSFSVSRVADVSAWATDAEDGLLDLRKSGPFRGRGALIDCANDVLGSAWTSGSSEQVQAAMLAFRDKYLDDLRQHSPVMKSDIIEFRAWQKKFAHWLYGTSHIHIRYSIEYDGVDIRKLSPGTRGIVLLLLYLALDDADDRPLIIDQPEENLDPKSVFDELVPLFIQAKNKRQVIIVTHNANLVINTDADQIIIAASGLHPSGALPPITYTGGGLENAVVREAVCDILEGGERAFRERARRLRVRLER